MGCFRGGRDEERDYSNRMGVKFAISSSYHRDDEVNKDQSMRGTVELMVSIFMIWPVSPSSGEK